MSDSANMATLLMVDDDPSMVRLVARVVERNFRTELNIESLTDPAEARARIERGGISILLTDLDMPEINGLDLLRSAKARNACTQVLFLTGHSSHSALLAALELGASDYLLKPVDRQELIDLVGQALARHHRWQKAILMGATSIGKSRTQAADTPGVTGCDTAWDTLVDKVKNTLSAGLAALALEHEE